MVEGRSRFDRFSFEVVKTRGREGKRPPLKIYKLTADGQTALKATIEHHVAVVEYLSEVEV